GGRRIVVRSGACADADADAFRACRAASAFDLAGAPVTGSARRTMSIAAIAFTAAVAGVWAGREVFPSSTTPGVELHRLLHDGLELDEAQRTKLHASESRFAVRRRALQSQLLPDNARLAHALELQHGHGPQV
ncbi:hypothetical protein OY671_013033, partial [Metschnikowia pulcherrima]